MVNRGVFLSNTQRNSTRQTKSAKIRTTNIPHDKHALYKSAPVFIQTASVKSLKNLENLEKYFTLKMLYLKLSVS